jgi:hypothetical protein
MTSKILVVSDDLNATAEITFDAAEGTKYECRKCGERGTDRGHFEDTVMMAQIHVERCA